MDKVATIISVFKKAKIKTSVFHKKSMALISLVPHGQVATYGQIAKLSGRPGHARQVVWTLHSSSRKYKLPWHRIINSQGKIGYSENSHQGQKTLLQNEGLEFGPGQKIDLQKFGWSPNISQLKKILKQIIANT